MCSEKLTPTVRRSVRLVLRSVHRLRVDFVRFPGDDELADHRVEVVRDAVRREEHDVALLDDGHRASEIVELGVLAVDGPERSEGIPHVPHRVDVVRTWALNRHALQSERRTRVTVP